MKNSKLGSILKEAAKSVNPAIEKNLNTYVNKRNQEIVKYQIQTGGKRLRPALAVLSCRMLAGRLKDVLYPAAGLEIIHNYALIIDDIIDHSALRRKKPTVWFKFGKSIAHCIGIDYSAAAFQAAIFSKEPVKISNLFARTMKAIADGEILDILFEQAGREDEPYVLKNRYSKITDKDFFEMAGKKTAALSRACCEIGGICASAGNKEIRALRSYGYNLGMAFQIRDDILDIFGQKEIFGKEIGKDIIERKLGNVVILFALKELKLADKKRFLRIMRERKIRKREIKEAMKLVEKTQARQKANLLGKKFAERAKKSLAPLPKNKWRTILEELSDFAMEREK